MRIKEILSSISQPNEMGPNPMQTVAKTPVSESLRPSVSTPTSDKALQETNVKSLLDSFVPSTEDLEAYLSVSLSCQC